MRSQNLVATEAIAVCYLKPGSKMESRITEIDGRNMNFKVKSLFSVGLLALLGVMLCAPSASADTYTYVFTGSGNLLGTDFTLESTGLIPLEDGLNVADLLQQSADLVCALGNLCAGNDGPLKDIYFDGGSCGDILGGNPAGITFFCTGRSSVGFSGTFSLTPGTSTITGWGTLVVTDVTATATPEPGTFGVMLIGLVALGTSAAVRTRKPLG
jgi:hypothetical protein